VYTGADSLLREIMARHILTYGLIGGVLIVVLALSEYRFMVIEHSVEIYGGLVAVTFAVLGIWLGLKLTKTPQERVVVKEVPVEVPVEVLVQVPGPAVAVSASVHSVPFVRDERRREELTITPREIEILELIARGMSNREIAEKLFVSENTVKTHSSRVFDKLGAKRRTQAVQFGKELGLLP
jgi:DNA-binding CsgD family transcriptional regulator